MTFRKNKANIGHLLKYQHNPIKPDFELLKVHWLQAGGFGGIFKYIVIPYVFRKVEPQKCLQTSDFWTRITTFM